MEINTEKESGNVVGRSHGASVMYIWIVGVVFAILTIVFLFFPRSEYSELEKRDLTEFPDVTKYKDVPGKFTSAISTWFSDTEPYRDELMTLSMTIRGAMRADFVPEEETITFRPSSMAGNDMRESEEENIVASEDVSAESDTTMEEMPNVNDGNAKLGDSGTIIVGKGENVRALMAFGGTSKGGGGYVDLLNTLAETFPSQHVYAIVAPLATEFYLPEKAAKASNPQKPFIYSIRDRLSPKVKFVDVYDELSHHAKEDIYLRTDHHWAPLGGYYAAKRLAQTAGVPFKDLDAYDTHVIRNFVGSMYGYSKDIAVKKAPEDFVYYTPSQVEYDAEFITYTLNKNFQIVKESRPYKTQFFKKFKDGSGMAYLTFMGSDQLIAKVKTSTPGGRKLLLIKDSYGNALAGNLFYSFSEVHVVDFRYFTYNLKDYVVSNGITDIAVCFNVFNAYSSGSASKVMKMITRKSGITPPPVIDKEKAAKSTPKPETSKTSETSETSGISEGSGSSGTSETSEGSESTEGSESSESSEISGHSS